jgi:hypothetical protein
MVDDAEIECLLLVTFVLLMEPRLNSDVDDSSGSFCEFSPLGSGGDARSSLECSPSSVVD